MDPNQNNPASSNPPADNPATPSSDPSLNPAPAVDSNSFQVPNFQVPNFQASSLGGAPDLVSANPFAIPASEPPAPSVEPVTPTVPTASTDTPTFSTPPPDFGAPVSFDPQNSLSSAPAVPDIGSSSIPAFSPASSTEPVATPTTSWSIPSDNNNPAPLGGGEPSFNTPNPFTQPAVPPSEPQISGAIPQSSPTPSFDPSSMGGAIGENSGGVGSLSTGEANPFTAPSASSPNGLEDAVPTDLSHLVGDPGTQTNPVAAPVPTETVIVPQSQEATQAVTGGGLSFPRWLIAVGVVVLLAVIGGSAYFILGVGKTQSTAESQSPTSSTPSDTSSFVPVEVPVEVTSTPSGGLGGLVDEGLTPSPTGTSSAQKGTSALELLRQRQNK